MPSAIVIGGGLSGLSVALRLSQYGWRVTVFERHSVVGGMNSYYVRHGVTYDTGLHAMTNMATSAERSAPFSRLLRQLRITREDLSLCAQGESSIRFPGHCLAFSNDIELLASEIRREFPDDAEDFVELVREMEAYEPFVSDREFRSLHAYLSGRIKSPELRDMICMPVMYYGNACERDMDLRQFCIIFRSLFLEGLMRPANGIRRLLDVLLARLKENGADVRTRCGIRRIVSQGNDVTGVEDDKGEFHSADVVISCAGLPETEMLLESANDKTELPEKLAGRNTFVEMLFDLKCTPAELGMTDCICFGSRVSRFTYESPQDCVCHDQYVLCAPGNFPGLAEHHRHLRMTVMANADRWFSLAGSEYSAAKSQILATATDFLDGEYPGFREAVEWTDMFTPKTIQRFTGRLNGAIYGSPSKHWDGKTDFRNLRLVGTDQGYLGIVGALLSGVTIANDLLMEKRL